jgi:hypothetical protein
VNIAVEDAPSLSIPYGEGPIEFICHRNREFGSPWHGDDDTGGAMARTTIFRLRLMVTASRSCFRLLASSEKMREGSGQRKASLSGSLLEVEAGVGPYPESSLEREMEESTRQWLREAQRWRAEFWPPTAEWQARHIAEAYTCAQSEDPDWDAIRYECKSRVP